MPVIVQTAHGGIDTVVSAMRAGAVDFVVKPVGAERLQVSLRNALSASALETEFQRLKRSRAGTLTFKDIVTRNARMQQVLRTAEKATASLIPVLIEGESGVGKELIARAIHGSGERRAKPFVAVNCGAIPENLVESTLFGHEKGAFTGATEKHTGKFVEASGGTLFLDEVGELPPAAQVKLLRAIQEGQVDPVGARKPVKVDVRIISATNRNLIADVKNGRFREDLFYRLHVFPITVPPLRERPEDIPDLVRHFLVRFAAEEGKRIRAVSADALAVLNAHPWPGNVRQLENAVFRAVVLADGDEIGTGEFPQLAARDAWPRPPSRPRLMTCRSRPRRIPRPRCSSTRARHQSARPRAGRATSPTPCALLDAAGNVRPLEELEADVIRFAIAHYRGQMSEVARRLRIGRSTLYRKLDDIGLGAEKSGEAGGKRGHRVTPAANYAQVMRPRLRPRLISLELWSHFVRWVGVCGFPGRMRFGVCFASSHGDLRDSSMQGRRFDRILTGTAIALVLGLRARGPDWRQSQSAIEALVPMPEPANLPPPSIADLDPPTETTGSTVINLPDPPDLPPPTFTDVAAPAAPAPEAKPAEVATPAPAAGPEARPTEVATPTPAPAPAPVVVAHPDQPLRDAIRELVSGKLGRFVDRKAERTAVEAFYSSRDYEPLWTGMNGATERARQAINHLRHADADGMDPSDYPVPSIAADAAAGRARRSRDAFDAVGARLRAPRPDGPRALFARQRRHLLRAEPRRSRSTS